MTINEVTTGYILKYNNILLFYMIVTKEKYLTNGVIGSDTKIKYFRLS